MKEIFLSIKGYEGLYEISNFGRVRTIGRTYQNRISYFTNPRILRFRTNGRYKTVSLCKNGVGKDAFIHRLVAIHFIPNPHNYPQVNHKDGNKDNNRVDNLKWVTQSLNMQHAFKNKLCIPPNTHLTEENVLKIIKLLENKDNSFNDISKIFKVNRSVIQKINNCQTWKYLKRQPKVYRGVYTYTNRDEISKMSFKEANKKFGISDSQYYRIKNSRGIRKCNINLQNQHLK